MSGTPWTDDETKLARQLFKDRAPDAEFRKRIGRAKVNAWHRIHRADNPAPEHLAEDRPEIPPHVIADATRRKSLMPRSLTAWLCGDPKPGESALDKIMAA